jgi:hypothetical protein
MINGLGPQLSSSRKQKDETQTGGSQAKDLRSGSSLFRDTPRDVCRRQKIAIAGGVALMILAVVSTASAATRPATRTAQPLTANDEGHLHLVGESGADLIEEGQMTGTIPGRVRVRFTIEATVSASFVLYPRSGGSIGGHGSGKLRASGLYSSFGGTMAVTSGTGRYRHAHGEGGFYGTILRHEPFNATVQTRGTLNL